MGKKKVEKEVAPEVLNVTTRGDGEIDPYASGVPIANPEPNNGRGELPEEGTDYKAPVSDASQDEVAAGRTE